MGCRGEKISVRWDAGREKKGQERWDAEERKEGEDERTEGTRVKTKPVYIATSFSIFIP